MIKANYLFKDVCKNNQHNTLIFFGAKNRSVKLLLRLNVLAAIFLRISIAQASGPVGGVVQTGAATITSSQNGQSTTIVQTTPKTSINWNQFSIDQGSRVTFIQPNAASIALNRVTGNMPSQISGQLLANGQVWILNPNGVLINRTGEINTASFLATTNALSDQNFQSGNYQFTFGGVANSYVSNYGSIIVADGGYAVLSGNAIRNNGLIQANLGSVVLAGAQSMTVDLLGNRLISFAINDAVTQTPEDGLALINNTGKVSANGGQVLLTAKSAIDMLHQVINTQGIVEAKTARNVNGQIVLDAGPRGEINIEGVVDASGIHANETGGSIKVFGNQITVNNNALLNASGDVGGGTIWVGGGPHGTGVGNGTSYMPALSTYLASSSVLNASAITNGNGGTIAVWSDITNPLSTTKAFGSILATGGELGGNGGWVETSGYHLMTNNIYVNTFAKKGITGMWLIDPADYVILEEGGDMSGSQLSANLGLSNLTISSTTGLGGQNGDIYVYDSITWNANTTLTLTAVRDIDINQSITAFGQNAGLILNPGSSGVVRMTAGQNDSTSAIVMNGSNSILNINGTLNVQPHDAHNVTATLTSLSLNRITVGGLTADTIGPGVGTLKLTGNLEISGTSNQSMSANVALQNSGVNASTIVFNNPMAPINVSGVISGQGNITVSSGSQITLSNFNSYSGETRIRGGTLELGVSGSLGSGDVVMSTDMINYPRLKTNYSVTFSNNFVLNADSTFLTAGYTTATISGVISGVGGLKYNSSVNFNGDDNSKPSLVLTNQNTYTGATVIYPHVSLKLEGNGSISNSEYIYNAGAFHISGITGSETSIKNLYGNGAYLGDKNLIFTEAGNNTTFGTGYLTGVFTGTDKSRITVSGGTLTMTAQNNDFFGTTNINAGATLALSGSGAIAASSLVNSNGTFDISAANEGAQINSLSGTGNVNLGARTLFIMNANNDNFAGVIADGGLGGGAGGSLSLQGGQQTLSGVNTYTGATFTYPGATLALSGSGSISNSIDVYNSGNLDISNTSAGATINSLWGLGAVYLGSQNLSISGASSGIFYGEIADGGINDQVGGGLTILSGTQTLAGSNTYTGPTETRNGATLALTSYEGIVGDISSSSQLVNNGTFDISAIESETMITALSGSGNVNLGANTLMIMNATNTNFSGVIADGGINNQVGGGVVLEGGQQTFSGVNTYTGATSIYNGTLTLSGSGSISNSSEVHNYASFDISNTSAGATVNSLGGSGVVYLGSQILSVNGNPEGSEFNGVIADGGSNNQVGGGLTILSGQQYLKGINTYTGPTEIRNGATLVLGQIFNDQMMEVVVGSIATSSGLRSNGTFDISNVTSAASITSLSGSGNVNLGANTLTITNADNNNFSGVIADGGLNGGVGGSVALQSGQQRFSGANIYTGATILNGGTLYLASDFGLTANIDVPENGNVANIIGDPGVQVNSQNAITVNRGATLDLINITLSRDLILNGGTVSDATSTIAGSVTLTANSTFSSVAGDTLIVAGVISDGNSGFGITKTGTGNLNLAANNTFTGATTISQGVLALTGTGSISSSSGVTNNANFDISATNSNVTINILTGSGTTNLGSQNLNMINPPNSYSEAYFGSGGISINGGPITYPNAQQPVVITPVVVQPVVVTPVVEQNPTVIAQVVINQVVTPDSVITPSASPAVGAETVSNNSDPVSVSGSPTTSTTSTTASTPISPAGGTSTAATPTTNTSGGTSTAATATPTTTETQTQPVSMANTTIGTVNAPPPATAATTATGGPTTAAVAPVASVPAQTPPAIVSKPVPKDNADTGDSTLASVKPPATTTESPKQPARNDVRVTSTTVTAGVTIQKVEPIKPSSTEYYNQVISGLWNPK